MRSRIEPSGRVDWGRRRLLKSVSAGVLGCGLPEMLALQSRALGASSAGRTARNVLVIATERQLPMPDGRPIDFSEHGRPIEELL